MPVVVHFFVLNVWVVMTWVLSCIMLICVGVGSVYHLANGGFYLPFFCICGQILK
jgi:hypothetical protein